MIEMPALYGHYIDFIMKYLDVTSMEQIECFVPTDDGEEVWEVPEGWIIEDTFKDCSTTHLDIGDIFFLNNHLERVVAERNASPLLFYRKRQVS